MSRRIRSAIIGCGQISDAHLKEISLLPYAEVVAVCDLVDVLAQDTAERFNIPSNYVDYRKMIDDLEPDVVHLTTPPSTHLPIGLDVMRRGCHVYIEKPFGTSYHQAKQIIDAAKRNKLIACAGFSQLFDHAALKLQAIMKEGAVGEVVHVETYYGDSLSGSFSRMFLHDREHWIHELPGKLFQNIISHALYHIVPFFPAKMDRFACFTMDRSRNGLFHDELRVMIQSGTVTGYLTFTSSVRPVIQFLKIYGTRAVVEVDLTNHTICCHESKGLPLALARAFSPISKGKHLIKEGVANLANTFIGRDRFFAGMGNLFRLLYRNISEGKIISPVDYDHVLRVSELMDKIIERCKNDSIN